MEKDMARPLAGRVAWVTGSSRGIGFGITEHLAELGAAVTVHGSRPNSPAAFGEGDTLESVAENIASKTGSRVLPLCADLTRPEMVHQAAETIRQKLGPIDILVNCAGGDIGHRGPTAPLAGKPEGNDAIGISYEDLDVVLKRNLYTCILCCQEVAPEMMARKSGRIVNIGSIAGLFGHAGSAIYSTAKAAVHEYTRCLADQLRPYDVAANVIAPGDILTGRFANSRETDEALKVSEGTMVRYGTPLDIAKAVAFLASQETTYITGQVLRVDGGLQTFPA